MKSRLFSHLQLGSAAMFVALTAFEAGKASEPAPSCPEALRQFVEEIDQVLLARPNNLLTVLPVVEKLKPVEHCNVDEALAILKGSRFFSGISEQPTVFVVLFLSNEYYVSFGVRKADGKIELPFAKVRK